jgi:hypothetical protein
MLIVHAVTISAQTEADFDVRLNQAGDGVIIVKYKGSATQVRIPATIEGLPVRELYGPPYTGGGVFLKSRVTSVVIPEGVTSIGWRAFEECERLTSVTIPESVTYIGQNAFYRSGLTSVTIPNGTIDAEAFQHCHNLRSLTLGEGVTSIGKSAFVETGINSVRLPTSLTTMDESVFYFCRSLTSVELPEGLSVISPGAFSYTMVRSVRIPSTIKIARGFNVCNELESVQLSEGVITIDSFAFNGCAIREIVIPSTVEVIEEYAFGSCSSLTVVTIPEINSIKRIARDAFSNCPLNLATQARLRSFGYEHK